MFILVCKNNFFVPGGIASGGFIGSARAGHSCTVYHYERIKNIKSYLYLYINPAL